MQKERKRRTFEIRIWLNKVVDLVGICSPISFVTFAHVLHFCCKLQLKSGDIVQFWLSCRHTHSHTHTRMANENRVVFNVAHTNSDYTAPNYKNCSIFSHFCFILQVPKCRFSMLYRHFIQNVHPVAYNCVSNTSFICCCCCC